MVVVGGAGEGTDSMTRAMAQRAHGGCEGDKVRVTAGQMSKKRTKMMTKTMLQRAKKTRQLSMHPFIEAYDTHCLSCFALPCTYTTGGGGGGGGGPATESRGDELGSLRRQAVQRRG